MGKPSAPTPPDPKETASGQTGTNVSTAIANAILQNPSQITPYGNLEYDFGTPDMSKVPGVETFTSRETQTGAAPNPNWERGFGFMQPAPEISVSRTRYRVGENEFSTLDEANAYRNQLAQELSGGDVYSFTDPYTGESYSIPKIKVSQTLSDDQQQMLDNSTQAGINLSQIAVDQSDRIGSLLNQPFNLNDMQSRRQFDQGQIPQLDRQGGAPDLQGSIDPQFGLTDSIAGGGQIQTSVTTPQQAAQQARRGSIFNRSPSQASQGYTRGVDVGQVQSSIGDAGDIQSTFDSGRNVQFRTGSAGNIRRKANLPGIRDVTGGGDIPNITYDRSDLGDIQSTFDPGRDIQSQVGDAGDLTRTYGTDFSEDRQRVEDALMERMNPQLDRQREQLESRLASQGIRIGSEPYQDAMDDYNRSTNDARLGAILGAGQEQSRLADLEARRAGFENAAQQQAFNQLLQSGQFANQAQQQQFGQNAALGQFANQAQAQGAAQTLQQDQMGMQAQQANAETQRAFEALGVNRDVAAGNQALQEAQFGNQAQQQRFNQLRSRQDAFNQAQQQEFGQNAALAQFGNQAQQQRFNQLLQGGEFANAAQQQDFANQQSVTGQNNAIRQQEFQNYLRGLDAENAGRNATLEERFATRNQPLNEIAALLSGSQVQNPQFTNANISGIPTTDVAGLINTNFNQQMGNYNAEMGAFNDLWGGIFGLGGKLGGAAIAASDRRLKREVRMVRDGVLPTYEYRYMWDAPGTRRRGYMAQDAIRVAPWAVRKFGEWLALDYAQLPEVS